ncbi:MAG: sugar transferase [Gaiellaceae bacterium]
MAAPQPRPGSSSQPRPGDSFIERFTTMVRGSPKRRVDFELRALDVILSGLLLILTSPFIALISLAVLLTSGRPILYRGERVGKDGKIFEMLKFRTLRPGAEERLGPYLGPELVERTRAETTRLGGRLRAMQLDELPQLWNVLRGQMSIVGPRPDLVEQVANYEPGDRRRLAVKPGITGWAQVMGRDEIPWEERFRLDAWYVDNWSLRLDARIVLMTFTQLGRPEPEPVEDTLNIERARRGQTRS